MVRAYAVHPYAVMSDEEKSFIGKEGIHSGDGIFLERIYREGEAPEIPKPKASWSPLAWIQSFFN